MKQFEAEQAHEFCKICGTCVEVSTHVVLGGGAHFRLSSCLYSFRGIGNFRHNRCGCRFNFTEPCC